VYLGNVYQCPFFFRWPVRTVSFSHSGEFLAYASEDPFIDIVSGHKHSKICLRFEANCSEEFTFSSFHQANIQTGRSIHQIPSKAAMNSVEWNPKYNLLAYAGDDKNKYQADDGIVVAVHSFRCICFTLQQCYFVVFNSSSVKEEGK
jgi:WD40 repeat protein